METGHTTYENGWTVSVISAGGPGMYEVWAWDANGEADGEPKSWLTAEEVAAYKQHIQLARTTMVEMTYEQNLADILNAMKWTPTEGSDEL